ncbi:MAG: DUF933 domain-containing protein [Acidobacteriota bacterium]|nr:DUF933 domain-containing protein [Acidobacteriota bacterium]MDY0232172.1 DUF933 domain-containing protein [Candidatus Saccharicenans sp.]
MLISIFGYRGTGKSCLYDLLSQRGRDDHSHGPDSWPNIARAVCQLPDPRLDSLAALYPDKKKINMQLEIEDFPGLPSGEAVIGQYFSQLRKSDGLVQVVRGFRDPALAHPRGKIDPVGDIVAMTEELVFSDLVMVTSRLEKLEKDLKKMKDPEAQKEKELLERLKPGLEHGGSLRELNLTASEEKMLRGFCFLSLKPILQMINLDEKDLAYLDTPEQLFPGLAEEQAVLAFCGKIEKELLELEEEERQLFMSTYGLAEPTNLRFSKKILEVMDLINFYTIGKNEVRAWSIKKNTSAIKAAGEIHTDIEKGFIKAEVIPLSELLKHGSWQKAREFGAMKLEGKDYQVQDGDVIFFRFAQ